MEFVGSIVDFGNAPEFHVSNICRIELISPNVVRVSYSAPHREDCGKRENRVVVHLDWDRSVWAGLGALHEAAKMEILGAAHEKLFVEAATAH